MPEVDESSPTLSHPVLPADPVSITDIVAAHVGFLVATLGVSGTAAALHVTADQLALGMGLLGMVAAIVRHWARVRASKAGI